MSISFESAVATLKIMFPDWDEETLSTILVSNNYHVENTIETVLSMGDTTGDVSPPSQRPISPPQAAPAPSRHQQSPAQSAPQRPQPSYQTNQNVPPPSSSSSAQNQNRNRGLRCELPADFLRPPNWQASSHTILADEELALMLQDELFQQQAREMLGENFMNEAYGQGQQPGVRRNASGRVQPAGQQGQGQHVYPPPPQADLGIMKALSSMGSAAKRNLTQLAQGFNSGGGTGGANSNTASSGTRSNRNSGENVSYVSRGGFGGGTPAASTAGKAPARSASHQARKKGSFNDLEDDEEGTEIITFSSSQTGGRSRHVLDDHNNNDASDNADADEEDGLLGGNENPLLQYKSNKTNNVNI